MAKADETSMKSDTSQRSSSLAGTLGMPCALLSLASGTVSLVVASLLWWGPFFPPLIKQVGEHAGVFSAALGLVLAGIGMASERRRVRWVALAAIVVNLAVLPFILATIFPLWR
jgi:hypothetical protein